MILEFVDPSFSGEYRLAIDPSEKDALLCVPGAGLGFLGEMGLADEASRFDRTDNTRGRTLAGNRLSCYTARSSSLLD